MKRSLGIFLTALLIACGSGTRVVGPSGDPAVAISKVDGPLFGNRVGALVDAVDTRTPRTGALLVAAAQQYNPVTGQTSDNPISVYVTASDEVGLSSVELLHNNTSMGTYLEGSDAQMFKNPFIFPSPRSNYPSVPIPGAPSGLVPSQLRALATDVSGRVNESAVLELLADGSRPNLTFSVSGDGPPYTGSVTLTGQAADPETGIRSFSAFLNGEAIEINPATPNSFDLVEELEPGLQTVRLVAVNGVYVLNEAVFTFTVVEEEEPEPTEPEPTPVDPTPTPGDNVPPTVSLTATPAQGSAPLSVTFMAAAADPDGDTLTYLWDFGDGTTAVGETTRTVTYQEDGAYTASVVVSDGQGGQATERVTVTVGDDGNGDGDGDGDDGDGGGDGDGDDSEAGAPAITSFVADPSSITSGGTSMLSWEIEGTATEVTISPEVGDVTTDDDNQVTVTPTETTTYTITATNEAGSDAQAVTVEVTAVDGNGGVEAVDDAAETAVGEPVTIEVLDNDEPDAEALTIVRATAPVEGGEVTISRDSRTITYTPPTGFSGTDTFRYTVRDGEGNTSTATVTVQVGTPD